MWIEDFLQILKEEGQYFHYIFIFFFRISEKFWKLDWELHERDLYCTDGAFCQMEREKKQNVRKNIFGQKLEIFRGAISLGANSLGKYNRTANIYTNIYGEF